MGPALCQAQVSRPGGIVVKKRWSKPRVVVISVGCEINGYCSATL
jgi:hypothetical protein